jgi:hypothetical protein
MIFLVSPSGHEQYQRELAELVASATGPLDAAIAELRARHDIEQLRTGLQPAVQERGNRFVGYPVLGKLARTTPNRSSHQQTMTGAIDRQRGRLARLTGQALTRPAAGVPCIRVKQSHRR